MNALPHPSFVSDYAVVDFVSIAAFNSSNQQVWSAVVDLRNYASWDKWLTVDVQTAEVSSLTFFATGNTEVHPGAGFWPSIDNMIINEAVPTPTSFAAMIGMGVMGLVAAARRRRKNA